jgi:hypothetical protein
VKKYFQTVLDLLRSWWSVLQDICKTVQVELQKKKTDFPADTGFLGDKVLATATMFRDTIKGTKHRMLTNLSSLLPSIFNFF